jgi:formylglycine-generating enzyme required for sulfatase activity
MPEVSNMTEFVKRFSVGAQLLALSLVAAAQVHSAGVAPAADYAKKSTWTETMLATRATIVQQLASSPVELGPWHATVPLPAPKFSDALFPEQGVDLQAKSPDGKPLWQARPELGDGIVHMLDGGGPASTYLFRIVKVAQATTVDASLGSDDGCEFWLNGQRLLSHDVPRGPGADQDRVTLALQPGENRVLFKIHNNSGGHGFYFRLSEFGHANVWSQIEADFPIQAGWMRRHLSGDRHLAWLMSVATTDLDQTMIKQALQELGGDAKQFQGELEQLIGAKAAANDPRWLTLYERVCRFRHRQAELKAVNLAALRRAIDDLSGRFSQRYPRGPEYLKRLEVLDTRVADMEMAMARGGEQAAESAATVVRDADQLRREALLANPLLDVDRLLLVRRKTNQLGLPQNWQGNCALPRSGYENQIALLSSLRSDGQVTTLFQPQNTEFVGDVDLHFDGGKLLFSMPGKNGRWQVWELGVDGKNLRQLTLDDPSDVDNYDACYLPDERIMFASTRCFAGVPCVGGGNTVANLCLANPDGSGVRQLCFDQDHNWCPTVLNNGRVLYSRWEYSDLPHYFSRLLFQMNPDGTGQMEYYASNSMWPNSIFYARPIPNDPAKVIAVISGHHGVPRMGELILFDPARGRREADGVVQRIPGYGQKVDPVIRDGLVEGSWPKFLHPFPLDDKYFLVSCQPTASSNWGIYLADVFDNMVLVKEEPGYALFEPVPLRKTARPPVVPDRVDPAQDQATVYLTDIYLGEGLRDVPRGTVKKLRLYSLHYAYPGMGGHINIGIDGPWDGRVILGTVPVNSDGSAIFKVPANMPIAVQPLDADGKALQIMRSWFTAMPGEVLSCVGCHETQNSGPPPKYRYASQARPLDITPWYGPQRGFSFKREVQPVLDQYCVGCHDGQRQHEGKPLPDFTAKAQPGWRNFTSSYVALHPFVRRPGPESDYHLQQPLEYHASISELVQILEKGHYNVKLDAEAWDRLITWIDMNVPDHGTWHEHRGGHSPMEARRLEMRTRFANRPEDPEAIPELPVRQIAYVEPAPLPARSTAQPTCSGWPFDAAEAKRRQQAAATPELKVDLGDGLTLEMALIPAGQFVMGSAEGEVDEYPLSAVTIDRPFYMGKFEITNAQFALFHPSHDSGYISVFNKDQGDRGQQANRERQPVVRITWDQAMAFCRWLSQETGGRFNLPTEAQWEYACRAGTVTPMNFGACDSDFTKFANLADQRVNELPRNDSPRWIPSVASLNDGSVVSDQVGKYTPNAFGLYDTHGNAAEWTRTAYQPYPYNSADGRDNPGMAGKKSVRGGSWYDRPHRARSSFRQAYQPWQHVYNVGFRVMMEADDAVKLAAAKRP